MPAITRWGSAKSADPLGTVVRVVRSAFAPPRPAYRATLTAFRYGAADPTTRLGTAEFWRATHTPDGPGTLRLSWATGPVRVDAWGPGGSWLADRAGALIGRHDTAVVVEPAHPAVRRALANATPTPIGASGDLYHELLPTILGQRITGGEALAQWRRLARRIGEPAPGPLTGLTLPPTPAAIAGLTSWDAHRLGIERTRLDTMRAVARQSHHMWEWAGLAPAECAARLAGIPGVGQWTIGCVLGTALGDPDAVAVGDFHLKNVICWALAGEPRGTDERMLELLTPYAGQRGRVVRALLADGWSAPKFGPRRRVLPMATW